MSRYLILLGALAGSALAQTPPGVLINVGGYRVHIHCTGTGRPAAIVIGGFSFDWALVQTQVAKFTRICSMDASGTAFSDPSPEAVPTCAGRVAEIHTVLEKTGSEGPYVLAGFSIGALFARLYAKEYPGEIAGLILIDHAFLPPKAAPPPAATGPDRPPILLSATPIAFDAEDEPGFDKLPQSVRELHRWATINSPGRPTAELAEECTVMVGDSRPGPVPLAVVSTGNETPGYAELQTYLLGLSPGSRHFLASESFHSIEISQPEIVVAAIRNTVEAARK